MESRVYTVDGNKMQFDSNNFKILIKSYGKRNKLKSQDVERSLANGLNVSTDTVHKWHYGMSTPTDVDLVKELAKILDFKDLLSRPVGKLSGGQRRRIDIARAIIHQPKILILDEPTTGLDPQTRKTLWSVIANLREYDHMTVFLTTHYMEEAAEADHVIIIDSGKIVAEGTPLELKNQYTGDYISIYGITEQSIKKLKLAYEKIPNGFRLSVPDTKTATDLIIKHPDLFVDYEVAKGKMDDVFLAVTGKKLTEGTEK